MELHIAMQNPDYKNMVFEPKELTPFTCPECNGVLSAIRDGNRVRYRCHTGHAFSADSLLAAVTERTEETLWSAIREMQETAIADRERIGQVLTNLLSNAMKYSPQGGDIILTSKAIKNGVKVSVQDHGIGIPENMINNIFDRFFRIANPQIDTYPGMGLSLYISAGIIERHGGTISVESVEGEGTTFYFTIPEKDE